MASLVAAAEAAVAQGHRRAGRRASRPPRPRRPGCRPAAHGRARPPTVAVEAPTVAAKVAAALAAAPAAPTAAEEDLQARRARLDKIKARVAEAAKPAVKVEPAPTDPARAAQKVLGLAHDLEVELARSREREEALKADLDAARADATRAAAETRAAGERLAAAEAELGEKRTVLADLLGELQSLEAERDEALRRAQAMAAIDEERARLLDEVSRRADEEARSAARARPRWPASPRICRESATDGARLRAALAELPATATAWPPSWSRSRRTGRSSTRPAAPSSRSTPRSRRRGPASARSGGSRCAVAGAGRGRLRPWCPSASRARRRRRTCTPRRASGS